MACNNSRIGIIAMVLLTVSTAAAVTWRWSNPLPNGNNIVDMTWNGSLSVQVAELGQLYTGNSFYGWFPQNSGTTNDLQAVIFFGNRIIFCGANGTMGYSDDGVNFTTTTVTNNGDWVVGLAASSNLVVAVGDEAIIYTSSDGAVWHHQAQPPGVGGNWLLSVAWGNGVFVTSGEGGYLANSGDGIHWTNHSTAMTRTNIERVVWISTTNLPNTFPFTGFWAVADDGKAIYSTNNGVNWFPFAINASTNILYGLAANNATALLAGDPEVRLGVSSSNAIIWPSQTGLLPTQAPVWTYYAALWDTNGAYRLTGDDGMMVQSATTNNNYQWSIQYNSPRDWLWQTTLAADLYVAVGENARIMTSQNGVDWSIEALPLTNSISVSNTVFFGVGATTNLCVAVGTRGSLAISPNNPVSVIVTNTDGSVFTNTVGSLGVIWQSLPAPTTNDLAGVGTFGNKYFIGGANATLMSSGDGTNWTKISVPATSYISAFAASSNLLVATGDQGLILTSPDGLTWTKRSSGVTNWLFRIRYLNGLFLTVGENGIMLKSSDGISWSAVSSGTTNWLNDAVMVSNTCYVVGNNGVVLAGTNFVNWSNIPTITRQSLYGAASQNGQLVVVGLQGTILRSPIIPDLNPLTIVSYVQTNGLNIFLVAGDPDQEFTLDSSTDLVNWATGPLLDLIYGSGNLVFLTTLPTNPPPTQFYRATLTP